MNIFKTIGKLGYRTQKVSTTIIKHPKQAWSDMKQGYKAEQWAEQQLHATLHEEKMQERYPHQPSQKEFDFS